MGSAAAKGVGEAALKHKVLLSIHAPYYINLCNPEKVRDSKLRIMSSVERAAQMGAWIVVFHPGFYGKESEKAAGMVTEACGDMAEGIERKDWNVTLGLETTGKAAQYGTLEEIVKLCREVKGCTPVVDWSHIFARNGGKIDYAEIFKKLEPLKLKRLHCHFSGIEFGLKGEKNHLTLAQDKRQDFGKLASEVLKHNTDITIISESPVLEEDSLVMKRVFEKAGHVF
jgi:deoxyribonuclease-4